MDAEANVTAPSLVITSSLGTVAVYHNAFFGVTGLSMTAAVGEVTLKLGASAFPVGLSVSVDLGAPLVYGEIDTNQDPNYNVIDDGQSPGWAAISSTQSPGYTDIDAGRDAA